MTVTVANSQMKSLEHYESVFWNTTKLLHTSMPPTSSTTPMATQYQHNRYWLVPRIGYSLAMFGHQPGRPKARQMISACSVALLFYCLLHLDILLWHQKSRRSRSSLQTLFTDFHRRNDQNWKISHKSPFHLLILDQYVSRWGLSDILGA